ncbi:hypothetical protein T09_9166 [Trichinella sp. T9]|nr:hypothetical protein T09_9166 [Trichinella sp. T9]
MHKSANQRPVEYEQAGGDSGVTPALVWTDDWGDTQTNTSTTSGIRTCGRFHFQFQ